MGRLPTVAVCRQLSSCGALVVPGSGPDHWQTLWPAWADDMRHRPGKWKRLLKTAQTRAVRIEAWETALQTHRGLLLRQLQFAGGLLACTPPPEWDRKFCCAPCGKTFCSRQKWSVHVFKCHGRLAPGRGVLEGRQCQHCLRHFGTNLKLCKHLAYSATCRHALCAAGYKCTTAQGQGSRNAEDPGRSQAPVLQASGPHLAPSDAAWLDELERPVAEIIDCLSCIGVAVSVANECVLWEQLRAAFSCVCSETSRLRLTAEVFEPTSAQLDLLGDDLGAKLSEALAWIAGADIVEWLVPAPAIPDPANTTFRDSELTLSMLEVVHLTFPAPAIVGSSCTRVFVGPRLWCVTQESHLPNSVSFPTEECLATVADGACPTFFDGPFEHVAFVFCADAWEGFRTCPAPNTRGKQFSATLAAEVFYGDLVRLALRLWGLGVPASLSFFDSAGPSLAPLSEIASLEHLLVQGRHIIRNHWSSW